MKPVKVYRNYRLVVDIHSWRPGTQENHEISYKECFEVKRQIERHCDGWSVIGIEWDSELICPYCHLTWELDEDGGPMCCQKAYDEWKSEQEAT